MKKKDLFSSESLKVVTGSGLHLTKTSWQETLQCREHICQKGSTLLEEAKEAAWSSQCFLFITSLSWKPTRVYLKYLSPFQGNTPNDLSISHRVPCLKDPITSPIITLNTKLLTHEPKPSNPGRLQPLGKYMYVYYYDFK